MLINLLEKYPVIAIEEAHMLGQVKGAIVQNNALVALSCTMENESGIHQFQVPISRIIMGSNAVMIQNTAAAHFLTTNGQTIENKMCVFTPMGDLVGNVTAVHISRDRILKGIHTESGYLKIEEIKNIGNVIIADSSPSPLSKEDIDEQKPIIKMYEEIAEFVVDPTPVDEPSICDQEETYDIIQTKYKYLLGKKLINTVTIAEQDYQENSIISAELIESSLKYNSILTLIMNTED